MDAVKRTVVSASLDQTLKFWDMHSHEHLHTEELGSPACQLLLNRDAGLVAVASDDVVVRVYDLGNRRLVRRFGGHRHRISDLAFSPDVRWLASSSMDGTVRVYDVPTAKCVDWLKFQSPVTSLCFSPSGEFLTTTHAGSVALFQWANRFYYIALTALTALIANCQHPPSRSSRSYFSEVFLDQAPSCLLYTSPSPRDRG